MQISFFGGVGGGGDKVQYGSCAGDECNNLINFTLRSLVNYDILVSSFINAILIATIVA